MRRFVYGSLGLPWRCRKVDSGLYAEFLGVRCSIGWVVSRATSRASWLPIPRAGPSADWSVTFASRALPRVGSPRIFDSPALSPQEVYMRLVGHRCIDADMQVVVVAAELTVGDRKRMRSSRQLRENTNKGIAPDLRMVSASMWCSSGSMGSKGRTRTVAVC